MPSAGESWIPVETRTPRHRKTRDLASKLGAMLSSSPGADRRQALGALVDLWTFAFNDRRDGNLGAEAAAAGDIGELWCCDGHAAVRALEEAGLLDRRGDEYHVHDWQDHGGALHAKRTGGRDRQRKSRAKSEKSRGRHADVTQTSQERHANVTEQEERRGEEKREEKRKEEDGPSSTDSSATADGDAPGKPPSKRSGDVQAVADHYRGLHPQARPGVKERALIAARLREGYSVGDLCAAIDGFHKSPWHTGENPGGKVYLSLKLLMRDSSQVAAGLEHASGAGATGKSEAETRNQRVLDDWHVGGLASAFGSTDVEDVTYEVQ